MLAVGLILRGGLIGRLMAGSVVVIRCVFRRFFIVMRKSVVIRILGTFVIGITCR
jgi:hypothetical protein